MSNLNSFSWLLFDSDYFEYVLVSPPITAVIFDLVYTFLFLKPPVPEEPLIILCFLEATSELLQIY